MRLLQPLLVSLPPSFPSDHLFFPIQPSSLSFPFPKATSPAPVTSTKTTRGFQRGSSALIAEAMSRWTLRRCVGMRLRGGELLGRGFGWVGSFSDEEFFRDRTLVMMKEDGLQVGREAVQRDWVRTLNSPFPTNRPWAEPDKLLEVSFLVGPIHIISVLISQTSSSGNAELGKYIIRRLRDEGFVEAEYKNGQIYKNHLIPWTRTQKKFDAYFQPGKVWVYADGRVGLTWREATSLPLRETTDRPTNLTESQAGPQPRQRHANRRRTPRCPRCFWLWLCRRCWPRLGPDPPLGLDPSRQPLHLGPGHHQSQQPPQAPDRRRRRHGNGRHPRLAQGKQAVGFAGRVDLHAESGEGGTGEEEEEGFGCGGQDQGSAA